MNPGPDCSLVNPTTTIDRNTGGTDIIEFAYRRRQIDGHEPFLRAVEFDRPIAVSDLIDDYEVLAAVTEPFVVFALARAPIGSVLVRAWTTSTTVSVSAATDDLAAELIDAIRARAGCTDDATKVSLRTWHIDKSPGARARKIDAPTWPDITRNYPIPVRAGLDALVALERPQTNGKLILWHGPPGTGKTTAQLIARHTQRRFLSVNAAAAGVKELRALLDRARRDLETDGSRSILFIDELHRFNRSQQDVLLPDVEAGVVSLIGATTANPFFSLVAPLVSRSQVFEFRPLTQDDIRQLLRRACADRQRGLGAIDFTIDDEAIDFLAEVCEGDGRRALSALEIGALSVAASGERLTLEVAQESIQKKAVVYDGTGDEHYDAASAFIKSIRGSDADAAIYWLARMLEAGEDPRFIARRIVISASEDIGNAVYFLCSDQASAITGVTLPVDAGWLDPPA